MSRAELTMPDTRTALHRRALTREQIAKEKTARTMLRVIMSIAALALALTIVAKFTGIGTVKTEYGTVVSEKAISILIDDRSHVRVTDGSGEEVYLSFSDGRGGFFRGVERAFSLKRRTGNVPADAPYVITRWSSGRMTLNDPATGHQVPVDAFGLSVNDTFADLMDRP